jgi:hypothetical protein
MSNIDWRSFIWRYLKFLIAFVLLLVVIDALFLVVAFLATSNDLRIPFHVMPQQSQAIPEYAAWMERMEADTPLARTVTFRVSPEEVRVNLHLLVDDSEPLARTLVDSPLDSPSEGFLLSVFGKISAGSARETEMRWDGPTWSLDRTTNRLGMSFSAVVPVDPGSASTNIFWSPSTNFKPDLEIDDELLVTLRESHLENSSQIPDVIRKDRVVFLGEGHPLDPVYAAIEFDNELTPSALTRQAFINRIGDISVPYLWRLLLALLEHLPLVILAAAGAGLLRSRVRILEPLKQLTLWMLSIHFLLYFMMVHVDLYNRYLVHLIRTFTTNNFSAYASLDAWLFWIRSISDSYDLMVVALVGTLLPLVFLHVPQKDPPRQVSVPQTGWLSETGRIGSRSRLDALSFGNAGWKKLVILLLDVMPYIGIASVLLYLWMMYRGGLFPPGCPGPVILSQGEFRLDLWMNAYITCLPRWMPLALAASLGVLLTRVLISAMGRSIWNRPVRAEVTWLAVLVILFMIAYPAVFLRYPVQEDSQAWGWFVFSIALGVMLLYRFGAGLVEHGRRFRIPFGKAGLATILLLVALALAIPTYYGAGRDATLGYQDDVARLAFLLDNLLIYLWIAAVLWVLYLDGKVDLSLKTGTRWVGVLAAAGLFYNLTARWFYIPATFLLGWLALSWLVRKPQWAGRDNREVDVIFKQVVEKRWEMLKNISLLRTAERTLGALQKKKREKLTSGEEDFGKMRTDLAAHINAIEKMRRAPLRGVEPVFKDIPLAFGPYDNAWKNGVYGAGWAFLFAVPWMVIYFIRFLRDTDFNQSYGLSIVLAILSIIGFWTALGFFMGFFFPYLRGYNGLQKGLWLALTVILPTLPLHIIHYQTFEQWQGFFLWGVQVLTECVLLGLLAFDYGTIRKVGSNWESLLEIHGFLPLGIWTSSVAVALVTAIGNLIADPAKALELWDSALKIFLPIFGVY